MQELKVAVPPSLSGHVAEAFHSEGLVYALNCMPLSDGKGLYLWRLQAHPDLQAQMFDPNRGDVFFDSTCAKGMINVLYRDGAKNKVNVSQWDGSTVTVLPWDYPNGEIGQITAFANGMALAIKDYGIFFVEWDEATQQWSDTYRLGALMWSSGQSAQRVVVYTNATQDLVSIDWADPELVGFKSWVSRIVIYTSLPQPADVLPDFEWTLEIVDADGVVHTALETYARDSVVPPAPYSPVIWTPLTFTFLTKVKLPITVRVKVVSGDAALMFEGASAVYWGTKATGTFTIDEIHMSVGGTLCPDGKVVAGYRGSLFGTYKGVFLQIAPAIDLEFQDEVNLESEVQRVLSYKDGVFVFCFNKTMILNGWTAKGVDVQEILPIGIPDHFAVGKSTHGLYMHFFGRLYRVGDGIQRIDTPFVAGAQAPSNVAAVDIRDFVLVSVAGRNVCLALDPLTNGYVFWRFDELGDPPPRPLQGCNGVVIFENGIAAFLSFEQFAPSYETVVAVATPQLDGAMSFGIEALEYRGQLSLPDQTEVRIIGFGDDNAVWVSTFVPTPVGTAGADADFSSLDASGVLEWLVPDGNGAVKPLLGFPIYLPEQVNTAGSDDTPQQGFVVGKKFLIELRIGNANPRSHADALREWRLYGQTVGQGILGRV